MQKQSSSSSGQQQSEDNLIETNQKQNITATSNESILYETKRISLRSCYIFRRSSLATDIFVFSSTSSPSPTASPLLTNGTNGSILDIIIPNTQTCYSIRFVDDMYARKWFYIIHSKISRSLLENLPEIEEHFYIARHTNEIKALGWLAEQVNYHESTNIKSWRSVFLVLTESEICFLPGAPTSRQTCREPDIVYPILSSR